MIRRWCLLLLSCVASMLQAQDTTQPWFPGDDWGFYRYLEDRLQTLGFNKPPVDRNGETVVFEFYITDSGYIDSVQVEQCFNFQLCYEIRQILNSMPRVNAAVENGKTVYSRRVYVLQIRRFRDGYQLEPAFYVPARGTTPVKLKWGIALIAVITMLIFAVK